VGVVAELAEEPGAEDHAEARLAQVGLSVPVSAKMVGHHLPQVLDLGVEGGDEPDLGGHDRSVGSLHRSALAEPVGAQQVLDVGGLGRSATAVGQVEPGDDLGAGQAGGPVRVGSGAEQVPSRCSASGAVRSSKARRAAGKNSRSVLRSRSSCRDRSQTSVW
jgi:hypothetical protein